MSDELLGEVTAAYVLKNRENGWLKYALQVLVAGPHLRRALLAELCEDVRESLERGLPGYKVAVETGEGGPWFTVDVRRKAWGELGLTLGNWKVDASDVAIGVYNYGDALSDTALAQIEDCLAKKRSPWNRKRYPRWIWNIWQDRRDWGQPEFLVRVAEDREAVVGEVTKELLEIVELTDGVLKRVGKADSQ